MIANYGYLDGSGEYFIAIDTDGCTACAAHHCLTACPGQIFEIITDDYDDQVAAVKASSRNTLKYTCSDCKPTNYLPPVPCVAACIAGALRHSW